MYCKKCGHELHEGEAFCGKCGHGTADAVEQNIPATAKNAPTAPQPKPKQSKKKVLMAAVIAVVIVAIGIGVGVFIIAGRPKTETLETTQSQTSTARETETLETTQPTTSTVGEAVAVWDSPMQSIAACAWHTVGLKKDGTVTAVGASGFGQCNVRDWQDIVAVAAGGGHTVGLKADGTVVVVGRNGGGGSSVQGW